MSHSNGEVRAKTIIDFIQWLSVGPYMIDVIEMPQDYRDDHEACGVFISNDPLIMIYTQVSFQRQLETLLHEIEHAIYFVANLDDKSTEEEYAERSTPIRMGVFRDNPHLTEILARPQRWARS